MRARIKQFSILCIGILIASYSIAQERWIDKEGEITFFSDAPLEDIQAINEQAMAILDTKSGNVAVSMLMREFDFPNELMEEHFNENYIESEQYPKATFTGRINDTIDFASPGKVQTKATGELTLHGITKPLETDVSLEIREDLIDVKTSFVIKLEDFDIDIPTVVVMKIAEEIEVTSKFILKPM